VTSTPQSAFLDLLEQVTREYCAAYEHADHSYLESQPARPDFTRNTAFNWIPQSPPRGGAGGGTLDVSVFAFEHPMLERMRFDHEPTIAFYDRPESLVGEVYFPVERFTMVTMQRFSQTLRAFIRAMVGQPRTRIVSVR
jgi:hypothetical protein